MQQLLDERSRWGPTGGVAASTRAPSRWAVGTVLTCRAQSVIDKTGSVDVSFNAVGISDAKILGVPLVELDIEQFFMPITTYATSYFLTARLAARRMVANNRE